MTNTTEMPVEIFTPPSPKIQSDECEIWDKKPIWHGSVSYTRTDTIPSKAEVAQEFMDEVSLRVDDTGMRFEGAADEVLKEWEDAESK